MILAAFRIDDRVIAAGEDEGIVCFERRHQRRVAAYKRVLADARGMFLHHGRETVGGGRVPVINCSGGTEVGACFLSPTHAEPIKIALTKLLSYPSVPIAIERGYFKDQGLDAQMRAAIPDVVDLSHWTPQQVRDRTVDNIHLSRDGFRELAATLRTRVTRMAP